MELVLLIGLMFFVAATVTMGARAFAMPSVSVSERLAAIEAYGFPAEPAVVPGEGGESFLERFAARAGAIVAGRVGAEHEAHCRKLLVQAGMYSTSYETFMGYRLLIGVGGLAGWLWLVAPSAPLVGVLGGVVLGLCGCTLPFSAVRTRAERRQTQLEYSLPELIDLLVVTVESGLSFSGSLRMAAMRLRGPLKDELGLALQEQRMGLSVSESLANMLERNDGPNMRSFVRAVLQGEKLGVSIGEIMRNLAVEMRKRRRQAAEERAQKAPIKILFPLVFLIFPAMFVVLLFPAAWNLAQTFGGG